MITKAFWKRDRRPLYQQITEAIRNEIAGGEFAPGERLPSEHELSARYGASRTTIREALRALEKEGAVRSRRGQGTFVVGPPGVLQLGIDSLYSVSDAIRRQGHEPSSREVHVRIIEASQSERQVLELPEGALVAVIERTRLADGEPVVYSIDTIPLGYLPGSDWRAQVSSGSLFDLLLRSGRRLSHTLTRFFAVRAGKPVSSRLGLPAGASVLLLEETVYDENNRPVLMSRDCYRTDRIAVQLVRRQRP